VPEPVPLPPLPAILEPADGAGPSAEQLGIRDMETYAVFREFPKAGEIAGPGYVLEVLESPTDKADFRVYRRDLLLNDRGYILDPGEPILLHVGPAKSKDGIVIENAYQYLSYAAMRIGNDLYPPSAVPSVKEAKDEAKANHKALRQREKAAQAMP
jgi:hypothetical protein